MKTTNNTQKSANSKQYANENNKSNDSQNSQYKGFDDNLASGSKMNNNKGRRKILIGAAIIMLIALTLIVAFNMERINQLYRAKMLFDSAQIEENFRSMNEIFNYSVVKRGESVSELKYDLGELPELYYYDGNPREINDFIHHSGTTGLIVLKENNVLFEEYFRGNTDSSQVISWSITKSIVSALLGIAIDEGYIRDVNEPVTNYLNLPEDCGYYGVKIIDVLQMSSGISFNEDYADLFSDVNRMGMVMAFNRSLDNFVASLQPEREPGTYNNYVSADTQILGMVIKKATGQSLTEYTEKKLWKPLGMESDAYWLVDGDGMEIAFGGFNAVLRDLARFGLLYQNEGQWNGEQIVPVEWVKASVIPDAPHLLPGENPLSSWILGYGYQWWIPEGPDDDYLAIGVYGQFVYVHPRYGIVIAKTSAYTNYDLDGDDMELESIEFFRAIARHFADNFEPDETDGVLDAGSG